MLVKVKMTLLGFRNRFGNWFAGWPIKNYPGRKRAVAKAVHDSVFDQIFAAIDPDLGTEEGPISAFDVLQEVVREELEWDGRY